MAAPTGRNRGWLRSLLAAGILALPAVSSPILLAARPASARPDPERYAAIVVDHASGAVLHAEMADEPRYPASLTKMMTLYVVFEALRDRRLQLGQRLTVSPHAAAQAPSKLGLLPGQRITVQDAILALTTKSANDAAVVVAEAVAGSEPAFAALMTRRAHAIGMTRSQFRNASGLPDRAQVTTARDMAILGRRLIADFPGQYRFFSTQAFRFRDRTLYNHNRLLASYEGMDGIKTGFINDSGFNLVASARRDGRRLVAAVFGGPTARERDEHMVTLLDRGFSAAETRTARARPGGSFLIPAAQAATPAEPPRRPGVTRVSASTEEPAPPRRRVSLYYPQRERGGAARGGPRDWSIQVGVFSSRQTATRAATEARSRLGRNPPRPSVTETQLRGQRAYRARLIGLTAAQAEAACATLQRRGDACLTVHSPAPAQAANRPGRRG